MSKLCKVYPRKAPLTISQACNMFGILGGMNYFEFGIAKLTNKKPGTGWPTEQLLIYEQVLALEVEAFGKKVVLKYLKAHNFDPAKGAGHQ